jgi:hypothetical protein
MNPVLFAKSSALSERSTIVFSPPHVTDEEKGIGAITNCWWGARRSVIRPRSAQYRRTAQSSKDDPAFIQQRGHHLCDI